MATGIKQLHSTPGNPTTPSLGTGTGTQGTARMIRPSNVNYDLEELSAALHYNDNGLGVRRWQSRFWTNQMPIPPMQE
jgi:hypothetical protein